MPYLSGQGTIHSRHWRLFGTIPNLSLQAKPWLVNRSISATTTMALVEFLCKRGGSYGAFIQQLVPAAALDDIGLPILPKVLVSAMTSPQWSIMRMALVRGGSY